MGDEGRGSHYKQNKSNTEPLRTAELASRPRLIAHTKFEADPSETRQPRQTLQNASVTGARTSPTGCSEPVRALKEKHPLPPRLLSLEEYSQSA
jgi:hypothetical protein